MTEVTLDALDGAQLVRTFQIGDTTYLHAWFGGYGFNVFSMHGGNLREVDHYNSDHSALPTFDDAEWCMVDYNETMICELTEE